MKNNLLRGTKVYLRSVEPEDLDFLYKVENNPDVWIHGSIQSPISRFVLKNYIERTLSEDIFDLKQLRLIICCIESNERIGTLDLYDLNIKNRRAGVGIFVEKEFRGKGVGKEALKLLNEYCFKQLLLKQTYAYVIPDNKESLLLFSNGGYMQSGILINWVADENGFKDVIVFQKLSEDLADISLEDITNI